MNPHERKRTQEDFRTSRQVCVATEGAGEGINLQFCRLMINYDLPWNPTRLEQRLSRIHRIGIGTPSDSLPGNVSLSELCPITTPNQAPNWHTSLRLVPDFIGKELVGA